MLCVSVTASPHRSTSSLRPLNLVTSHNNNNDGGLHACVPAVEDIDQDCWDKIFCCSATTLSEKKDYGQPTRHFRHLLVVFGFFFYCLFVFMRMLHLFFSISGEFQAPPIGLEYELQRVESFTVDPFGGKYSWNDAEEDGWKKEIAPRETSTDNIGGITYNLIHSVRFGKSRRAARLNNCIPIQVSSGLNRMLACGSLQCARSMGRRRQKTRVNSINMKSISWGCLCWLTCIHPFLLHHDLQHCSHFFSPPEVRYSLFVVFVCMFSPCVSCIATQIQNNIPTIQADIR